MTLPDITSTIAIENVIFCAAFAILNRARGTQLFGLVDSTTAGRIVATFFMAATTALLAGGDAIQMNITLIWTWATLFLWTVFAWDKYWAAAIGNPVTLSQPAFPPVDWIMAKLPSMPLRAWGTIAMGLRQLMGVPCMVGLAFLSGHPEHTFYSIALILFGVPYLIAGYVRKASPIGPAEYTVGGLLGMLILLTVK